MVDHNTNNHTTERVHHERVETRERGNGSIAFIVGALVVVVAVLAWMFLGADGDDGVTSTAPAGDTEINVDMGASGDDAGAAAIETAPEVAEPAPADEAAPADAEPAVEN